MIDSTNEKEVIERARVYDRVRMAYARERAKITGGWLLRDGRVEVLACPFVDRLNGLLSPQWPEEEVPELWRRAVALYQTTKHGMYISFGPGNRCRSLVNLIKQAGGAVAGSPACMYLELEKLKEFPAVAGLRIERIDDFSFFEKHAHPWLGLAGAPYRDLKLRFLRKSGEADPPRLWEFVALYQRRLAGSATVFIHKDEIAFFDVVVDESLRRRGIGTQLMVEACRWARDSGIRAAGLAADGEAGVELYAKIGFEPAGFYEDYYCAPAKLAEIVD